jgi:hypothetical protein
VYKDKLAAAIKVKGAPLREHGENVYIPFGEEYTLMLNNYGTSKALVNIDIDGERAMTGLVVQPNQIVNLERYQNKPHKFKFIERTEKVEGKRGIRIGDGLVRISYKFEQILAPTIWTSPHTLYYPPGVRSAELSDVQGSWCSSDTKLTATNINCHSTLKSMLSSGAAMSMSYDAAEPMNQGITVQGSVSDQKFKEVLSFTLEDKEHVMVFKLNGKAVEKPITNEPARCKKCNAKIRGNFCSNCGTKAEVSKPERKKWCPTCGEYNSELKKFCPECGTNLE